MEQVVPLEVMEPVPVPPSNGTGSASGTNGTGSDLEVIEPVVVLEQEQVVSIITIQLNYLTVDGFSKKGGLSNVLRQVVLKINGDIARAQSVISGLRVDGVTTGNINVSTKLGFYQWPFNETMGMKNYSLVLEFQILYTMLLKILILLLL